MCWFRFYGTATSAALTLLYSPIGLILVVLRVFLIFHILIISRLLPKSDASRFVNLHSLNSFYSYHTYYFEHFIRTELVLDLCLLSKRRLLESILNVQLYMYMHTLTHWLVIFCSRFISRFMTMLCGIVVNVEHRENRNKRVKVVVSNIISPADRAVFSLIQANFKVCSNQNFKTLMKYSYAQSSLWNAVTVAFCATFL